MRQIGGFRPVLGVLLATGAVSIPLGLSIAKGADRWWAGSNTPPIQILLVLLIWFSTFSWGLIEARR
jgi:hypothetical protein